MVAGLIPWLLVRESINHSTFSDFSIVRYAGLLLLLAGVIITLLCIIRFATDGRGTLSPADPTKELVIAGLYRYSRNPMYIGVMSILTGECLLVPVTALFVYTVSIFIAFNLFIIFYEEPRLRKDFGEQYINYCRRVRRWL